MEIALKTFNVGSRMTILLPNGLGVSQGICRFFPQRSSLFANWRGGSWIESQIAKVNDSGNLLLLPSAKN